MKHCNDGVLSGQARLSTPADASVEPGSDFRSSTKKTPILNIIQNNLSFILL